MLSEVIENVIQAIQQGRADVVRSVITLSGNVENTSGNNFPPEIFINNLVTEDGTLLHLATKLNQADIVRLLLLAGADPGVQNENRQNSIELAQTSQMEAVYMEELLKATADANIGRICQLIAAGVSVNCIDSPQSGNTPLHWAATFADIKVVKCLLDRGANVNAVNCFGVTPFHDAVHRGDIDIIQEMLGRGADPHVKASKGKFANKTPMDLAASTPDVLTSINSNFKNGFYSSIISDGDLRSNSPTSLVSFTSIDRENSRSSSLISGKEEIIDDSSPTFSKKTLISDQRLNYLCPKPKVITQFEEVGFKYKHLTRVFIITGDTSVSYYDILNKWDQSQRKLENLGCNFNVEGILVKNPHENENWLTIHINRNLFRSLSSYKLRINNKKISIIASELGSFQHALSTLIQVIRLFSKDDVIPQLMINDWPSTLYRGILIDVTDNRRIMTLESLFHIIEAISHLKMNQLYFYTQYSEGFKGIPYSNSDLTRLDRFCYQHHIEMVPGVDISQDVLNLDGFITFLHEFLSHFSVNRFLLIGPKLTNYLIVNSILNLITSIFRLPGRQTFIFCVSEMSQVLEQSLFENSFLLKIKSELENYDFHKSCLLAETFGVPYGIVTQFSTPESLTGLTDIRIINNYHAAQYSEHKIAVVNGNWCEQAFPSPPVFNWPSLVVSAAMSWNANLQLDVMRSLVGDILNFHVFEDDSNQLGNIVLNVSRTELQLQEFGVGVNMMNGILHKRTLLLELILAPDDANLELLTIEKFAKVIRDLKRYHTDIASMTNRSLLIETCLDEIHITLDFIHFACRLGRALVSIGQNPNATGISVINLGIANLLPTTRTDLANRLIGLVEQFRKVWLKTNLKNGLEKAIKPLEDLLEKLIPDKQGSISQI